jgi:hypothetical protein
MKAFVECTHCGGSGSIELTGVYAETLNLVILHPGRNGAALAGIAGCEPTAMNNRLRAMERRGVVTGKRFGRSILWTHKKN